MADGEVRAQDLAQETASTLSGNEQFVMFDSTAGKRADIDDVATYVAGDKTTLKTTNKTSPVAAINENFDAIADVKEDFANYYTLKNSEAQLLADATDYDTLKTPGNYYVNSSAKAGTMIHCPASTAHRLTVISVYDSGRLKQIVDSPTTIYIRYWDGSAWGVWASFAYASQIDTKVADYEPLKSNLYTSISNNTDYNSLTTSGVYKCLSSSVAQSLTNCPVTEAHCLIVRQTSTVDRYSQMIIANSGIYFRYYTGSWGSWKRAVTDGEIASAFISSPSTLGDSNLDTIRNVNTFYLLSSSHTYSNTPDNLTMGYLEVVASDSWTIQKFFNLGATKMWIRRINAGGVASSWTELGTGSGGGTIENTYNITTSPTITTDTNGWLQAVDTDTADETGKTDMTGAIMSMLIDTGYCHLGEGIFYVSGNIDMPVNSVLCGCGDKTQIRLLQSTTTGYCVKITDYCTIKDVSFSGSRSSISPTTAGTRNAINFTGGYSSTPQVRAKHCVIENVIIRNFSGSGIYCYNTSLSPEHGLYATNIYIENCYAGINIYDYSEFHKFTNICTNACYYGVINNSGNNVFTACTFRATHVGYYIDGTMHNSGHGTINGCTFCHIGSNAGSAITMENVGSGFVVSNCQFWYNSINLIACQGIVFSGCEIGNGITGTNEIINISGGKTVMFSGCMFRYADPVITIASNDKVKFDACYEAETGDLVDPTAA